MLPSDRLSRRVDLALIILVGVWVRQDLFIDAPESKLIGRVTLSPVPVNILDFITDDLASILAKVGLIVQRQGHPTRPALPKCKPMTELPMASRVMRLSHRVEAIVTLRLSDEASLDELLNEAKLVAVILGRLFRHLQKLTVQGKIAIVLGNDLTEMFTLSFIKLLSLLVALVYKLIVVACQLLKRVLGQEEF